MHEQSKCDLKRRNKKEIEMKEAAVIMEYRLFYVSFTKEKYFGLLPTITMYLDAE